MRLQGATLILVRPLDAVDLGPLGVQAPQHHLGFSFGGFNCGGVVGGGLKNGENKRKMYE